MRSLFAGLAVIFATTALSLVLGLLRLLRVREKPGGIYDFIPRWWSQLLLGAAGVRVRVHGAENIGEGEPRIFTVNHVSWFDVPAVASLIPRARFVAKAELFKVPMFGLGMRAVGMIAIQRENRKAAFGAYEEAAARIRAGTPVVVYPEGTRGRSYVLRPFKKGPFVLAIAAGVPIVPVVVHGTIEIMARGSWRVRPGVVDIHFLPAVPTDGRTYEDRDRLLAEVHGRMERLLAERYGVGASPPVPHLRRAV